MLLCLLVGARRGTPSSLGQRVPYPRSGWGGGGTPSSLRRGVTPSQVWMGVPHTVLDGGYPIQSWMGVPHPGPHAVLDGGYPPCLILGQGTPHLDTWKGVFPSARLGTPLEMGWGTPLLAGWGTPPPKVGQTHTCENTPFI